MHTSLKNKTALVTGVTSGIGREIAQLLAERGARVFGTVRNPKSAKPIPGVEIVRMDVTDDSSVNEAVQGIEQKAGLVQLLVNNAGYSFMGALEETSIEEARQQFETNLFGVLRVTNSVLPGMRQQGYGRIVNISSVLGFLPAPYMGIYVASKHAVEGYTETLDHEVRRFGVRALLVEPAQTKTNIRGNSKFAKVALDVYADERKRLTDVVQQSIEHGDDPRIVAEAVYQALTAKSPRLRYPVGKGIAFSRMRRFVPASLFDKSFRKQFQLDRRPLMAIGLLAGWLTVALMAGGCSKPAVKDSRLQSPRVEVFKAEPAGSNSRTFTGIVEARVQSDLGFRVAGKILERSVDVGQRVQKGQPLMRLDPEDLRLSAAAQEASVEAARAKYTQAKADETRSGMLVKSGVISPREYDQDRAALDSAKAQLEAAEAQARVSNNSSEYAVLLADADGVIVRTLSEPGQVVAAGQTLIQLAHDGPREALINLPEGVRPDLGAIASARLYGQDQMYQARLRQLSDAADPASRTFEARYVLEGEAASAPLGSTVTITSIGQEEVVVSRGVNAGEKVVALGAHLLHEGQVVKLPKKEETSYAKF